MAATEPEPASDASPAPSDQRGSRPRISTRTLVVVALLLVVLLVAAVVVSLVLVHQPTLLPVPIPSVSRIS